MLAAPGELAPRLVYADFLQSQDHPLAFVFASPDLREVPEAFDRWWHEQLLGEPGTGQLVLHHGFPREVDLFDDQHVAPGPLWALVERGRLHEPSVSQLEALRALPRLARVHANLMGLPPAAELVPKLAVLPVHTLSLSWREWSPDLLGERSRWSALRVLALGLPDPSLRLDEATLGPFAGPPLAIEVGAPVRYRYDPVELAWNATRQAAPALEQVRFELLEDLFLTFAREGSGPMDILSLSGEQVCGYRAFWATERLPRSEVRRLEVVLTRSDQDAAEVRARLTGFPEVVIRDLRGEPR